MATTPAEQLGAAIARLHAVHKATADASQAIADTRDAEAAKQATEQALKTPPAAS